MKDNLDTHIDSKIKNSFESLQSKAPIHLWDNISEQIDTEQTLDDVLDRKVENSYLNQADKTAPVFLWGSITNLFEVVNFTTFVSFIDVHFVFQRQ